MDRYRTPASLPWPAGCDGPFEVAIYRDRCVGSLVAGALGDGLGFPVESWSRERILEKHGPAGVTDLPAEGARWSDDTQLTVAIAESLIASGGLFHPNDFVRRLREWMPVGRGVGTATRAAIRLLNQGKTWDQAGPEVDSSGNGAAMRTAPVGLLHALDATPAELLTDSVRFSLPTHGGEIGVASTVAMAAGTGYLARLAASGATEFDPQAFVDFIVAASAEIETKPTPTRRPPGDPMYLRDRLAAMPSWLDREPQDVFDEIWTGAFALESVPAAIFAFLRTPGNPRAVLLNSANASHDTDTIAAMAGNLLGAWLGAATLAAALPGWWDRIERRDHLERLGEGLAALGVPDEAGMEVRRDAAYVAPPVAVLVPAPEPPAAPVPLRAPLRGPDPEPTERRDYEAPALIRQHPLRLRNANKEIVFGIACPDRTLGGHVSYTRWAEMPLPESADPARAAALLTVRDGFYDYVSAAPTEPGVAAPAVEWHVNFADPNVFYAYGSELFAQDEIQVAEHPALGCLREALVQEGRTARVIEAGCPTPVLVMGVERRVHVDTGGAAERGGPSWLYGRAFARAAPDVVRKATSRIDPPTISNILAIAAPVGGHGRYRRKEIELGLATAYSGFRAAVLESRRVTGPDARTVMHSGFWGCGAFGGNRVLMSMLQLIAAEMAELDGLVLHVGDHAWREPVDEAAKLLRGNLAVKGPLAPAALIAGLDSLCLEWGESDGN